MLNTNKTQTQAHQSDGPHFRDMLDIIFAERNRAYGAYQLRRDYSDTLSRAFFFGLLFIGLLAALPFLAHAVWGMVPKEAPVEVVATLGAAREIDRNTPPPVLPPPTPTPPPPTRATARLVPPVVDKDENVLEERPTDVVQLAKTNVDVGTKTRAGDGAAPPPDVTDDDFDKWLPAPTTATEEKTYEMFDIQKPPAFPGGEAELMKFLSQHIEYPGMAKENAIQGVVVLNFLIGRDGSVSEVNILKDIGGGCGKEAVRVVKSMPKWLPGEANGNTVKVRFTLPVRFRLN